MECCTWCRVARVTAFVSVPVPAEYADEVRRFAAFLAAERAGDYPTVAAAVVDGLADYPLWADADVVAFANAGTVTSRIYRRIVDAVLEHGATGRWVSIAELAEWTGQSRSAISTFRTHLYRYINAHMGSGTLAPFTRANGQDLRPARGREVCYRISAECAEQWGRVQSQLEGA